MFGDTVVSLNVLLRKTAAAQDATGEVFHHSMACCALNAVADYSASARIQHGRRQIQRLADECRHQRALRSPAITRRVEYRLNIARASHFISRSAVVSRTTPDRYNSSYVATAAAAPGYSRLTCRRAARLIRLLPVWPLDASSSLQPP